MSQTISAACKITVTLGEVTTEMDREDAIRLRDQINEALTGRPATKVQETKTDNQAMAEMLRKIAGSDRRNAIAPARPSYPDPRWPAITHPQYKDKVPLVYCMSK